MSGASPRLPFVVIVRLAARGLRGGLRGYGIFLACIALGVAAIAGVGSVAGGLAAGLARDGRTILGGDAAFSIMDSRAPESVAAGLAGKGSVSQVGTLRAMARSASGDAAVADVKAVDQAYPLAGAVALDPPQPLAGALAERDGRFGIVADAALPARLNLKLGDTVAIGTSSFVLRAILAGEPDKLAGGISLGPRVLMSIDGLKQSGLLQPGALVRWTTRILLPEIGGRPVSDAALAQFVDQAKAANPDAGWDVRTRNTVSPEFDRNLARFTQFLTLVGLTALIVGGVGVANAVQATVDRKRATLAVLKALGATGGAVFAICLVEVLALAILGTVLGLLVGAALPFVVVGGFGALIPFPMVASVVPAALGLGALYGILTALTFSLAAIGRAHDVAVSALFRDAVDPDRRTLRPRYRAAVLVAGLALAGVTVLFATDRRIATVYVGATVVAFLLLRGVALGLMALARLAPHPRGVIPRLALTNIHRPGALTPTVVLSLGLGLALLVTLTLIDVNIRGQLKQVSPGRTPSFYFIDVPSRSAADFTRFIGQQAPDATVKQVPMLRGRITALKDEPVGRTRASQDAAWVLEGDRGITFADTLPAGSTLVAGAWWPADYAGPPLLSFDDKLAKGLGLGIGDAVTVNVLGRTVTARIANLRRVDWESYGINFVMVFSPNTFRGAPYAVLASAAFPDDNPGRELALLRSVASAFPTITTVRVKDALDAVSGLVERLALAIRGASSVAIAASILVLGGAIAAGRRTRVYEAVILKVLGATRRTLLAAYLLEYGLIGLATAIFGVLAGTGAAWFIVARVMAFSFAFAWGPAVMAAAVALAVTVLLGLVGTWRILGRKPGDYLRAQ